MAIRITWPDSNITADSVKVYRSLDSFPITALPTPIATLAGSETQYDDKDVLINTVYHYRVGIFKGDDLIISDEIIMGNFPDTGPGPQTLKMGNWKLGYFGVTDPVDLLQFSQIYGQLELNLTTLSADTTNLGWHKFIREGKILYFSLNPFLTAVTFTSLYNSGLIYGVDGPGFPPPATTLYTSPVNQKAEVVKGNYRLLVRAPSASTYPVDQVIPAANAGFEYSEYAETVARLLAVSSLPSNMAKWGDYGQMPAYLFSQHSISTLNAQRISNETPSGVSISGPNNFHPILELKF